MFPNPEIKKKQNPVTQDLLEGKKGKLGSSFLKKIVQELGQ